MCVMWCTALISEQVGLLLLSQVLESNPEPFKPHYSQLLTLFSSVLQDHNNPTALYYCILTLTAITPFTGTEEMVRLLKKNALAVSRSRLYSIFTLISCVFLLTAEPDAFHYSKFDYSP